MSRFVHVIADYGVGDPAAGEVIQRLKSNSPDISTYYTSVPAFDSLATGFWIYQFGMGEHPEDMFIYSNTAPRKDNKKAREQNAGEHFIYAKLENGVDVMAVNAGYCFSFIKPHIRQLRVIQVKNEGSQFRSRDFYPAVAGAYMHGEDVLGDNLNTDHIPDVPQSSIGWIDGYGNIKTTIRKSEVDIEAGTKLKISINGVTRTALVAGGNFSVSEGELSFSPGSSGYEDPFMELFLRGGSAEKLFEFPRISSQVLMKE